MAGRKAIATCDPALVAALRAVPTTTRKSDRVDACVVLTTRGSGKKAARSFLGTSTATGNEINGVVAQRAESGGYELVIRLGERGTAAVAAAEAELPLALDLDGTVVGDATLELDPAGKAGFVVTLTGADRREAEELAELIEQSRSEDLVGLVHTATMTRRARELMARADARLDEKAAFRRSCGAAGATEASEALVLGCYDGRIFVLRVTRPDLAGIMPVTAAHEMLHAAFDSMPRRERRETVRRLEAFMEKSGDPRIEQLLELYEELEPGERGNELHSLVGTQVRDLPRALERYYARYFEDRSQLVDAFEGYQTVFDYLQANYDRLSSELDALKAQMDVLEPQVANASAEAESLFNQIRELREQGRVGESNRLVDAQNAAADNANALAGQFNALVDQYNAKVTELNELAFITAATYSEISPFPIEAPG